MAKSAPGVGSNVLSMMTSLTTATEAAVKLAGTAQNLCATVTSVTEQSHRTLMELSKEAANIAKSEVSDFSEAMRETQASGEGLTERCLELNTGWSSFEDYVYKSFDKKQIGKDDVQQCIFLLKQMLESAAKCAERYKEFKEKLLHAIKLGSALAGKCKVAADDAKSRAANAKAGGIAGAGFLGAAALGFLAFATGGLALVGAAAAGAAAAGAGAYAIDRVRKLNELAAEFDNMRGTLDNSLRDLNKLGDSISGLFAITEGMVEKMEIALKIFKEHERVRQENEKRMLMLEKAKQDNDGLNQKNEELEKKVEEYQAKSKKNEELEKRIEELEAANKKKQKAKCRNM